MFGSSIVTFLMYSASVIRKGALEYLDLTDSHLGDDGVTVLAQALHGNEVFCDVILSLW